jgi:hypothetical protein
VDKHAILLYSWASYGAILLSILVLFFSLEKMMSSFTKEIDQMILMFLMWFVYFL